VSDLKAIKSEDRLKEGIETERLTVRVRQDLVIVEVLFCDACKGEHEDLRFRRLDGDKWFGHCPSTKKPLVVVLEEWRDR
jgi:hypothetical protein